MNLADRAQEADQAADNASDNLSDQVISSISGHINTCFQNAESAKSHLIKRLLTCERQRKGEYEPELLNQIKSMGAQEIFMMLTDIKCRAADAWIKDVILNHNESTWALSPTIEPDLPPEIMQEIAQIVMQEAAMVAQAGVDVTGDVIEARKAQVYEEAKVKAKEVATDRAKKMEDRISDKLQEGGFREAISHVIYDFTTYPAAFFKGPVLRKKPVMKWGPNFQPIVTEEVVMEVERISPYDAYPSPNAVSIQDGYFIHRQRLTRTSLRSMRGMAGTNDEEIIELLKKYPNGYKMTRSGEATQDALNERHMRTLPDGTFDTLEYWGPVTGLMLKNWGMDKVNGAEIDEYEEYQINAWQVAGSVVRVVMNPNPLNQRPYSKASFIDIPGSFWGKALPEVMADVQTMCNASARALAMNMGIASGPQVEVSVDRMAPGSRLTNMVPWKLWQTTMDRTGGGQPAIRFHQPDMHVTELLSVFTHFSRMADEVTGVPNYLYGSTSVGGAGRTASGLSMLMENASKGIKHAIMSLDAASSAMIQRYYTYIMIHDPDTNIKGDMNIIAAGAIGAMIREQQEVSRREFMAQTLNPVDMQIIGVDGRAHMLREHAKTIFPDVDKVVPDPDKIKAMVAMQQQAAAEQQAMQQADPSQGPQPGMPQQGALPQTAQQIAPTMQQAQQDVANQPPPNVSLIGQ